MAFAQQPIMPTPAGTTPPAFRALDLIEKCLRRAQRDKKFSEFVVMDLRSVTELRARFAKKEADTDALKWLRQLAIVWSTRFSGLDILTFRELFKLLEKCPGYQR